MGHSAFEKPVTITVDDQPNITVPHSTVLYYWRSILEHRTDSVDKNSHLLYVER